MAEMHPEGTFNDVEILDHYLAESKTGTPYLWVEFRTEHGTVYGNFFLTENAAEQTMKKIKAMGFKGDELDELNDGQCLVGNVCQITVEHDTYEGKTRPKVGWVNDNHSTIGPQRSDVAASNAAKFNALWRRTRGEVDDIPF